MRQQFSFVGEEFHVIGHGHSIRLVKVNLYVTYKRSNSHATNTGQQIFTDVMLLR